MSIHDHIRSSFLFRKSENYSCTSSVCLLLLDSVYEVLRKRIVCEFEITVTFTEKVRVVFMVAVAVTIIVKVEFILALQGEPFKFISLPSY